VAIDGEKITRWYDLQAPLYRLWRDNYDGPLVREVHALLRSQGENATILDAGCGTGLFSIGLARVEPGWRFTATDASQGMLAVARGQAARRGLDNIDWQRGDATALPFDDGSFDVVVAAGLMPCLNEPAQALAEFQRLLRRGGCLITVEFDRASMGFGARLFFRTMILGYKTVSALMPRYRFATAWDIDKSTIDPERHRSDLASVGLEVAGVTRVAAHICHQAVKRES
jgi:ubiquinone/menaquinone biosynthesis C-methylase UbiE